MSRAYLWFCAVLLTFALLTGCGKKDEDASESAAAAESQADSSSAGDDSNPFERAMAEREQKRAERKAAREAEKEAEKLNPKPDPALAAIERVAAKGDEKSLRQADMMRAQYEYNKIIFGRRISASITY